jgi:serine phosphatase RsbU (regulator of sigma subunit)
MAYMFSDGYADQFGGEKGKKFMVKRFYDLLMDIHAKDIMDQKYLLLENLEKWKGNHEQVDDVLVIGIGI